MARPLEARWLGCVPYNQAWALQRNLAVARLASQIPDTLLLLEHPHVYTLGRTSLEEHILVSREVLAQRGATIERIDRGGEVTYHGPGQLVAYPIILLEGQERHLDRLVWKLEQAIIATLGHYGARGHRRDGQHGVWVEQAKIASIGLHVRRWVVTHGLAINVAPQMDYFTYINPCGHADSVMTSLAQVVSPCPPVQDVASVLTARFAELFDRALTPIPVPAL